MNRPSWLDDIAVQSITFPLKVNPGMIAGAILYLAGSHLAALCKDSATPQIPAKKNAELTIEAIQAYWCFFLQRVFDVFGSDHTLMRLFNTGIGNHINQYAPIFESALSDDILEQRATFYLFPSRESLSASLADYIDDAYLQEENAWWLRILAFNARFSQILEFKKQSPEWMMLSIFNVERLKEMPTLLSHLEPSFAAE